MTVFLLTACWAGTGQQDDALLKAVALDAGKMSATESKLFQESIVVTKESIARDSLDAFYHDAVDYYHQRRYDEALDLLDKISSIDPYYENVQTLRDVITQLKTSHDAQTTRRFVEHYMRQGDNASAAGQTTLAISYWKKALAVNPSYGPAKRRIQSANHNLAQHQFEMGYLHYSHGDFAEALECWQNTIALDSTYKQRGLLLLMSKVDLQVHQNQVVNLAAQAEQQYEQQDLAGALQTYQDLLQVDPRHEEARRMVLKIKFQLGLAAFKAARTALDNGLYAEAIKDWEKCKTYEYEVPRAQEGIQEAERLMQKEKAPKLVKRTPVAVATSTAAATPVATAPTPPPAPATPANPEESLEHYRAGLAALRSKDYHHALDELKMAAEMNPGDEHVYIALQRAQQEWYAANAANAGGGAAQ